MTGTARRNGPGRGTAQRGGRPRPELALARAAADVAEFPGWVATAPWRDVDVAWAAVIVELYVEGDLGARGLSECLRAFGARVREELASPSAPPPGSRTPLKCQRCKKLDELAAVGRKGLILCRDCNTGRARPRQASLFDDSKETSHG